jgi:hypothetical protein
MPFVLLIVAVAILGGVWAVATGRGGELVTFRRDVADWPALLRTPADVAGVRLPLGIFGYQAEATSVVLTHLTGLLAERDAEIARLRGDLERLGDAGAIEPPSAPAT